MHWLSLEMSFGVLMFLKVFLQPDHKFRLPASSGLGADRQKVYGSSQRAQLYRLLLYPP